MRLLYYKPSAFAEAANEAYPGTLELAQYFKLYSAGAVPIDRTGTIQTPVAVHSLFPMPKPRPISLSFEDICNARASEILTRAEEADARIFAMWSGGIDSTLLLVSLLKCATSAQRSRITVLLSEASILENPNFYREHVAQKLQTETSTALPYIIGNKSILVSGEHNDQLFGSDIMAPLIAKHGTSVIHQPYDRAVFFTHYNEILSSEKLSNKYLDLFETLKSKSPLPITSNFDFAWWINFSLKWQTVFARLLTFVAPRNRDNITAEYARGYYFPFYNTEDFQLWSMNNMDKRIKETWSTYKWPCKDIIYDYTKDADYRDNKLKRGSLHAFMRSHDAFKFLDTDYTLHEHVDLSEYYVPENDFK